MLSSTASHSVCRSNFSHDLTPLVDEGFPLKVIVEYIFLNVLVKLLFDNSRAASLLTFL